MELNDMQLARYSRTIRLAGVGVDGQLRLCGSSVAIVGAGALGSAAAMYLAASGVGTLRIADFDTVDISNLQRQLTYTADDLGAPKTAVLARRIAALNADVNVEVYEGRLDEANADDFVSGVSLVIEGSDNPATKYIVSDAAHRLGITCILGAVGHDAGQLMVMTGSGSISAYRRVFGAPPESYTPCSQTGLAGPLPGVVGTMQALMAVNLLTGRAAPADMLMTLDALTLRTRTVAL